MIIIKKVEAPCQCYTKLGQLEGEEELWLGSIVECDCGQQYILTSDSLEDRYWAKYNPDPRLA